MNEVILIFNAVYDPAKVLGTRAESTDSVKSSSAATGILTAAKSGMAFVRTS
jgi:hypothetical protein